MQVDSVAAAKNAPSPNTAAQASDASSGLDYNAFLQLLIAELKNQDPTKPMDSAQYIAQLAGFSNVEQSVKLNSKLDTLISGQTLSQADSLIGRTVTSADGSIKGEVKSVHITDSGLTGELVDGRTLELGPGITIEA